jgi:acyl-coenzyme A thioesterase PaaI-like protein
MAWNYDAIRELAVPVFGEELLKRYEADFVPVPWASNKLKGGKQGQRNFLHGELAKERVFCVYFFDKKTAQVVGLVHFGLHTEGPVNRVHGGALLTVLDEAIGTFVGFVSGFVAVTKGLDVRFRKFVALDSICAFSTRVLDESDREMVAEITLVRIFVKLNCFHLFFQTSVADPSVVHATAKGVFHKYRKVQQAYLDQQDELFDFPRGKWRTVKSNL